MSISIGTILALVLATVVQMIFGELYPKNLAIANPEPLARGLARSTTIYLAAFGWLITVFDHAANALLRREAAWRSSFQLTTYGSGNRSRKKPKPGTITV